MKTEDQLDIVEQEAFKVLKASYMKMWDFDSPSHESDSIMEALGLSAKWQDKSHTSPILSALLDDLLPARSFSQEAAVILKYSNTLGEFAVLMHHVITFKQKQKNDPAYHLLKALHTRRTQHEK